MSRKTIRIILIVAAALFLAAATAFIFTRPHGQVFKWIHHGIRHGGYPVLFLLLFCCGLGLPLPEDIPLIVSGILVQNGEFSLGTAALVAWCGIIGGDCMLYLLGQKFGNDIVNVPIIGRGLTAKRLAVLEEWFVRWGIWVVAIGRMFAGIRGAMVVVAGASRFNFWKFIIADGLAAIVSGGLFLLLGYKFAQHRDQLEHLVKQVKGGMLIGAVALALLIAGFVWWRKRKFAGAFVVLPAEPTDPPPAKIPFGRKNAPAGGAVAADK